MVLRFTEEPLYEVIATLQSAFDSLPEGERIVAFEAIDPDVSLVHCAGEIVHVEGVACVYRSHKVWVELAEQLGCRTLTPKPGDGSFLHFRFAKLSLDESWHEQSLPSGDAEKYGAESGFFRIHKLEDPSFLVEYMESLQQLTLPPNARILNLGINRGDEFLPFASLLTPAELATTSFVGIDHAASALACARSRFPADSYQFVEADLNAIVVGDPLDLGLFDLIISIGTLHSPKLRSHDIFRTLVCHHLTPGGHVLLGFPNCRYLDHEVRYGAKMKNYSRPELSILWKEVAFHKRYLQQHDFRVTLTGKHAIFVTGKRLGRRSGGSIGR